MRTSCAKYSASPQHFIHKFLHCIFSRIEAEKFERQHRPTTNIVFVVGLCCVANCVTYVFTYVSAYARRRRFTPATANSPNPIMAHVPGSGVVTTGGGSLKSVLSVSTLNKYESPAPSMLVKVIVSCS